MTPARSPEQTYAFLRANLRSRAAVEALRRWQTVERQALDHLGRVVEQTANPFIRVVLEIVRHDSLLHHRVERFLVDSITDNDPVPDPRLVARLIEDLDEHERNTHAALELAAALAPEVRSPLDQALLEYLVSDVKKHQRLLAGLRTLEDPVGV